jgi:hypothetical protein
MRMNQMKNILTQLFIALGSLALLTPIAAEHAAASDFKLVDSVDDLPANLREKSDAFALVKVFPFKNRRQYIQCTGMHIGSGTILTAGHCFLGSYNCNGATVSFGIPGRDAKRGTCTKVLMNEAAGSAYNGTRNDYALFKVDIFPEQSFDIRASAKDPVLNEAIALVGYPRLSRPRNRDVMAVSTTCAVSKLNGVDLFGRPRAASSILHNCPTSPGMNGGMIVGADTSDLVAIQQAGSIQPKNGYNPLTITAVDNVAQSLTRLENVVHYEPSFEFTASRNNKAGTPSMEMNVISSPSEVRIGSHLAEAFPLGISEPITLVAGHFRTPEGSSQKLSIAAKIGSGSILIITDANGKKFQRDGLSFFEDTEPRSYDGPLTIQLNTTPESKAFLAHLRIAPVGN